MQKPDPGELLALRVDRARPLFEKWLRDEELSGYLRRNPKVAAILVSHRQDDIPPQFDSKRDLYHDVQG